MDLELSVSCKCDGSPVILSRFFERGTGAIAGGWRELVVGGVGLKGEFNGVVIVIAWLANRLGGAIPVPKEQRTSLETDISGI